MEIADKKKVKHACTQGREEEREGGEGEGKREGERRGRAGESPLVKMFYKPGKKCRNVG